MGHEKRKRGQGSSLASSDLLGHQKQDEAPNSPEESICQAKTRGRGRFGYDALNRGNARQKIFLKDEDFEAVFLGQWEGLQRYSVELLAFTTMPDHWQMVHRRAEDGMLRWVPATHTQRHHAYDHTSGEGHLYPPRFKSFRTCRRRSLWDRPKRMRVARGRRLEDQAWTQQEAQRTSLAFTIRPRRRPRKAGAKDNLRLYLLRFDNWSP